MSKWTVLYWVNVNGKRDLIRNDTPSSYAEAKALAKEVGDTLIIEDYKAD